MKVSLIFISFIFLVITPIISAQVIINGDDSSINGVFISPQDTTINFSIQSVNTSNSTWWWDGLDTPSDINAADITDDGTYLLATGDTATGNYTFDSGTFFIDSINDRVGIGTSNPYSGLHYQGDILYLTPNAGADSNDNIT
ncbi:hypothetical protein LCGC14_0953980, partial [marine sediment metagenome]